MKKNLTKQDVKNVAKLLMQINDTTTTLEVKKELRENDYFAEQQDVSNLMDQVSAEEGWFFSFNGTFRTYSLVSNGVQNQVVDPLDDTDEDDSYTGVKTYTKKNGKSITSLDPNNLPKSYWKVTSPLTNEVYYYDVSLNREKARWAFYKMSGLKKGDSYKADIIDN